MEATLVQWLLGLFGAAIVGLVGYVIKVDRSVRSLELKVSDDYVKRDHLAEIKADLHSLRDLVYRIAVKMDVPTFTEPYR